jgi:arginyl-tRNA synthetase
MEAKGVFEKFKDKSIFDYKTKKFQKILIEYPSPNTNKALHIGHTRNLLLGNSLKKILEGGGHEIIVGNMNNDRGIAICKAMLSYKLWGKNKSPKDEEMKPDHFVSRYYVMFEQKNKENPNLKLEEQAQEMLLKWEEGDKDTIALWRKLMRWVFEGYKVSYRNYKYKSDRDYFESEIYKEGKDIVLKGLKKGVFEKDETGAIYCDLEDKKLGKKYLLRKDGTTLYMTQDLYLANLKEKEFKMDKSIFIVGQEQKYHFDVLFEILDRLGFKGNEKNYHFAFGMVYDKDGKKFSSRKGNAFGADDFLELAIDKAKSVLKQKSSHLSEKEIEKRSAIIGYGALTFGLLKINPLNDINFDVDASLSFDGETGPYLQYTYARIKSILRKAKYKRDENVDFDVFEGKEIALIKLLKKYPEILSDALLKYKISAIANYLLKVAQKFNDFYQNHSVLNAETEDLKKARLLLCDNISQIIKHGLNLLDIETLEEM